MSRQGYGLSDEELDEMFDDAPNPAQGIGLSLPQQQHALAQPQGGGMQQQPHMPYQIFPLGQTDEGLLTRKIIGIPVWAWGLVTVAGGGAAAWWLYSQRGEVKKNDGTEGAPSLPASLDDGEWGPSRTAISDQVRHYFVRKGQANVACFNADEAKKKRMPHVSPVVTIKLDGKGVVDKELQRICKREGLNPVVHADGTIGLYPGSGKKGREWEKYIDELREAGQDA